MKEVNSNFNFRGALNAEHYQVHSDLLDAIPTEVASGLGLIGLRNQYVELFKEENSCYLLNRSYAQSDEIREKHASRVQQFSYILKRIDNESETGGEETQQAAKALLHPVKPYRAAKRMRYAATTGALTDFINRMRESDGATHIETLQLTEPLSRLETLNQAFNAIYQERSGQRFTKATSHNMATIRPLVDKAFKELARAINALYQANALTEQSETKEQQLVAIIDRMNAILYQLQLTLSRVKAGAKPNPGEEAKPTTPAEPDTPTEPEPEPNPNPDESDGPDII